MTPAPPIDRPPRRPLAERHDDVSRLKRTWGVPRYIADAMDAAPVLNCKADPNDPASVVVDRCPFCLARHRHLRQRLNDVRVPACRHPSEELKRSGYRLRLIEDGAPDP